MLISAMSDDDEAIITSLMQPMQQLIDSMRPNPFFVDTWGLFTPVPTSTNSIPSAITTSSKSLHDLLSQHKRSINALVGGRKSNEATMDTSNGDADISIRLASALCHAIWRVMPCSVSVVQALLDVMFLSCTDNDPKGNTKDRDSVRISTVILLVELLRICDMNMVNASKKCRVLVESIKCRYVSLLGTISHGSRVVFTISLFSLMKSACMYDSSNNGGSGICRLLTTDAAQTLMTVGCIITNIIADDTLVSPIAIVEALVASESTSSIGWHDEGGHWLGSDARLTMLHRAERLSALLLLQGNSHLVPAVSLSTMRNWVLRPDGSYMCCAAFMRLPYGSNRLRVKATMMNKVFTQLWPAGIENIRMLMHSASGRKVYVHEAFLKRIKFLSMHMRDVSTSSVSNGRIATMQLIKSTHSCLSLADKLFTALCQDMISVNDFLRDIDRMVDSVSGKFTTWLILAMLPSPSLNTYLIANAFPALRLLQRIAGPQLQGKVSNVPISETTQPDWLFEAIRPYTLAITVNKLLTVMQQQNIDKASVQRFVKIVDENFPELGPSNTAIRQWNEWLGRAKTQLVQAPLLSMDEQVKLVALSFVSATQSLSQILLDHLLYRPDVESPHVLSRGILFIGRSCPLSLTFLDGLSIYFKIRFVAMIIEVIEKRGAKGEVVSPAVVEVYTNILYLLPCATLVTQAKGGLFPQLTQSLRSSAIFISALPAYIFLEMLMCKALRKFRTRSMLPHILNLLQEAVCCGISNRQLQHAIEISAVLVSMSIVPASRFLESAKMIPFNGATLLNRILVIGLARAVSTFRYERKRFEVQMLALLRLVESTTPLRWSSETIAHFPSFMRNFYQEEASSNCNVSMFSSFSDVEVLSELQSGPFQALLIENPTPKAADDLVAHVQSSERLRRMFLCILWNALLIRARDQGASSSAVNLTLTGRILTTIPPNDYISHIPTLIHYVVRSVSRNPSQCIDRNARIAPENVNFSAIRVATEILRDFIFRYQIVKLDIVVFSLISMIEHCDVAAKLTALLLLETGEISKLIKLVTAPDIDYRYSGAALRTNQSSSNDISVSPIVSAWQGNQRYLENFPEKHSFEILYTDSVTATAMPALELNMFVRLLPALDMFIGHLLEIGDTETLLELLKSPLASLYLLHTEPLHFVFATLRHYHTAAGLTLSVRASLCRLLIGPVGTPITAMSSPSSSRVFSSSFHSYLRGNGDNSTVNSTWVPDETYAKELVIALTHRISAVLPKLYDNDVYNECFIDDRFDEYPNICDRTTVGVAVELMSIPLSNSDVGSLLITAALNGHSTANRDSANSVGLLLATVSPSISDSLIDRTIELVQTNPLLRADADPLLSMRAFLEPGTVLSGFRDPETVSIVGLWHAFLMHLPPFFARMRVLQLLEAAIRAANEGKLLYSEFQLLFFCRLFAPLANHIYHSDSDKSGKVIESLLLLITAALTTRQRIFGASASFKSNDMTAILDLIFFWNEHFPATPDMHSRHLEIVHKLPDAAMRQRIIIILSDV